MHEGQLRWLQHNRGNAGAGERRHAQGSAQPIRDLAPDVLSAASRRSAVQGRVEAIVAEGGGSELLAHAAIVGVREGVLTFQVSEPAVLYHVRLSWERWVREMLHTHGQDLGINEVRFVAGQRH